MKLIDLLVKELPKRGGWPDGAEYCHLTQYDRHCLTIVFSRSQVGTGGNNPITSREEMVFSGIGYLGNTLYGCTVTYGQYESALAASQKPAWNGEGLPPVGCECEYISNGTSWGKVKVIGFDGEKIVIRPSGEIYYAITPSDKDVFTPLRTEAERKRDAALDAIYGAIASAKREHNRSDEADEVYKAIAAGKIPGVKLEN